MDRNMMPRPPFPNHTHRTIIVVVSRYVACASFFSNMGLSWLSNRQKEEPDGLGEEDLGGGGK